MSYRHKTLVFPYIRRRGLSRIDQLQFQNLQIGFRTVVQTVRDHNFLDSKIPGAKVQPFLFRYLYVFWGCYKF